MRISKVDRTRPIPISRLLKRGFRGTQFCQLLSITFAAMLVLPMLAFAAPGDQSPDGVWTELDPLSSPVYQTRSEMPSEYGAFEINTTALNSVLSDAPMEFTRDEGVVLTLPMPDGGFAKFSIVESPILSSKLQLSYPEIKTYSGQGLDDPTATVRLDRTMYGFRAMVLSTSGTFVVDPVELGNTQQYMSYWKRNYPQPEEPFQCLVENDFSQEFQQLPAGRESGDALTSYRLAMVATGEYHDYFGGVAGAVAAIVTTVNRVTGIYERDVAIRLNLVRTVIFTDPDSDPFAAPVNSAKLDQNQQVCDDSVGAANYDIGHLVSANGGGGLAAKGVCQGDKARAATQLPNPQGDPYDVDYVAHEMGHQFGGDHTFNGTVSNCGGGNRVGSSAYEPGSGSTIMAYAGICGSQNVQNNSDPYFHNRSIVQIIDWRDGTGSCGNTVSNGNSIPTANAQSDYTIPTQTPFKLTGAGSDPDGDALTYCWEQYDLGSASPPTDFAGGPLFRSLPPKASASRTFPDLDSLLMNATNQWEKLPTVDRNMTFRLTVRDNRAGGGGVDWDDMTVTVDGDPFFVTSPNGGEVLSAGCDITVDWVVGGGDVASDVNIWLSTDGGYTLDHLLAQTENDGSETVTIPCGVETNDARVLIAAQENIFFDVSDNDFTVESNDPTTDLISATGGSVDDNCQRLVTFAAVFSDDCELLSGDVDVSVSIPSANASFDPPTINKTQIDGQTVGVNGSVLVYTLTGSPATVRVDYTVTDNCGNVIEDHATAQVVDDIAPVIACPDDTTFECNVIGDFGFPEATDNCDASPDISLIDRDSIPGDCPQEYQLVLTYEAEDEAGNTDMCQQTITIEDTTPPEITCPDVPEFVFTSPKKSQVFFEVTATDNCNDDPATACDSASGSTFIIGEHTITCGADDGCGNVDSCSFTFRLVPLDIKPNSCPNPLNLKAARDVATDFAKTDLPDEDVSREPGGVVPVAILGTDDLDVENIKISSLRLEGVEPLRFDYEDVATPVRDGPGDGCECTTERGDGLMDLTLRFGKRDIIATIDEDSVSDGDYLMLQLTGEMNDGTPLAGGDCVVLRLKGPKTAEAGESDLASGDGLAAWNNPNPFNPSTTISYRLPQSGKVSLVIYNVLGQEVNRLVNERQNAGVYSISWDGRDASGKTVASGMYFYRLQVEDDWITRKMILLK